MLASEIKVDGINWHYLPIPNRDSYRLVKTKTDVEKYVAEFGNPEVTDNATGYYYCPTFEAGRRAYRQQVEKDCQTWGCSGT